MDATDDDEEMLSLKTKLIWLMRLKQGCLLEMLECTKQTWEKLEVFSKSLVQWHQLR